MFCYVRRYLWICIAGLQRKVETLRLFDVQRLSIRPSLSSNVRIALTSFVLCFFCFFLFCEPIYIHFRGTDIVDRLLGGM